MNDMSNYLLAWLVYVLAGVVFYAIFWRITRFKKYKFLSYSLRAITLAIMATPWYVGSEGDLLAPALIVMLMDAITIGRETAVRALVPLFLAIIIAFVIVIICLLFRRRAIVRNSDQAETE